MNIAAQSEDVAILSEDHCVAGTYPRPDGSSENILGSIISSSSDNIGFAIEHLLRFGLDGNSGPTIDFPV